jgi:hypothetical protein
MPYPPPAASTSAELPCARIQGASVVLPAVYVMRFPSTAHLVSSC